MANVGPIPAPFDLISGDLLPSMSVQLGNAASIAALATAQSVAMLWLRPDGTVVSVPMVVVDPVNGIVQRVWSPGDSVQTGEHRFQVVVTASNSETATDPVDGSLYKWWVYPRISGPSPIVPPAPIGAGTPVTAQLTCADSGGVAAGGPVYVAGSGTFARAEANALATTRCFGLAASALANGQIGLIATAGPLTLLTNQWDAIVTGESGGLTPGATYYLSDATPGFLTTTAPSTPGHYSVEVGQALTSVTMLVSPKTPIFL